MEGDYGEEVQQILDKLQFKSIDDLLQADSIAPEKIGSRSLTHEIIVSQYLHRLHQIILKTQLLPKKIYPREVKEPIVELEYLYPNLNFIMEEGEIVEVLGRANSGKSTLMAQCMIQALEKKLYPILLSSTQNISIYLELYPELTFFQFDSLADLVMLLHAINTEILSQKTQKYIIIIDCLSKVELEDEAIEFDCSQKFRKMLTSFTNRTQSLILYSYRISQSLFSTQYKKEHHRLKCKNSKEWDGWANKTIVIDHLIRRKDHKAITRINLPKSLNNKLYEFIK